MADLGGDLAILLVRELEGFEREISLFPDDETVWKTAPGLPNSAGNLALHVAGNLQHFVGAILGGTGYVRDRGLEFGRRSGPRGDVLAELRAASRVVGEVLRALPAERFDEEYPELLNGLRLSTGRFLIHLSAHAGFHLGQAGYARRAVTGDSRSSGPIPLQALVG